MGIGSRFWSHLSTFDPGVLANIVKLAIETPPRRALRERRGGSQNVGSSLDMNRGGVTWQSTRAQYSGSPFFMGSTFSGVLLACVLTWCGLKRRSDGWQTTRDDSSGSLDFVPGFLGKFFLSWFGPNQRGVW